VKDEYIYDVIVGFLQDAIELEQTLMGRLENATRESVKELFHDHLVKRMNLIALKLPREGALLPQEREYNPAEIQALVNSLIG